MSRTRPNNAGKPGVIEKLVRRERWIIGTGLVLICTLAWWYVFTGAGTGMSAIAMSSFEFPPPAGMPGSHRGWSFSYWLVMLMMWWVMMIAMMVPSAAPAIQLYGRVFNQAQQVHGQTSSLGTTAVFAAGYLFCWFAFSITATMLQWVLERAGLVHGMLMWSTNTALSASFLIAAGMYQLTPVKQACLNQCRSPLHFLTSNFQKGRVGAFRMGVTHGAYCVGCCWVLMALLFVGGIMNLLWIAGLAAYVLIEKVFRFGVWVSRIAGLLLIALGVYLLVN